MIQQSSAECLQRQYWDVWSTGNFWESSPSGGHKTGWGLGLTTDKWLPHTKFPCCEIEEKKIFEDNKLLSIWGHMKTNKNCTIYKWFNL